MKVLLFIVIILIFILIIPIPLKLIVHYDKDLFYVKIFKFQIFPLKKKTEEKLEKVSENIPKETKQKVKKKATKNAKRIDFSELYYCLSKNPCKIKLKINGTMDYSLGDAAYTAEFFGVLHMLSPLLYNLLGIIFKIPRYEISFYPQYKDNLFIDFTINCIFTFNLAKLLYILLAVLASRK